MVDFPVLWHSILHTLAAFLRAIRQMPRWVLLLMILAAIAANVLASGVLR